MKILLETNKAILSKESWFIFSRIIVIGITVFVFWCCIRKFYYNFVESLGNKLVELRWLVLILLFIVLIIVIVLDYCNMLKPYYEKLYELIS